MKINDLNLNNWRSLLETIRVDSLWLIPNRDNSGAHHGDYHGLFVPEIPRQAMLRYTKKGDWILDAFAGSGTSLIEARRMGRNSVGIELNKEVGQNTINHIFVHEPNPYNVKNLIFVGDSSKSEVYNEMNFSFDLVILHPPYHNIIKFSEDPSDLSQCHNVLEFTIKMEKVFQHAYNVLKPEHFMVLVVGDYYADSEQVPLSYMLMELAMNVGFRLKSHVIKDIQGNRGKRNQTNLWKYRALAGGFYIFKHESIFFFWKPAQKTRRIKNG